MRIESGELVYLGEAFPRPCPACHRELTRALGVVVEHGIYNTHIVTTIDRSRPDGERVCAAVDGLGEVGPEFDGVIHGSPEDVAAAVDVGWLPPGAESYGCQFQKL